MPFQAWYSMRGIIVLVATALTLTAVWAVPVVNDVSAGESTTFTEGTWTYSYNETISEYGVTSLGISGTMRLMSLGIDDITKDGITIEALTFYQSVRANVTGYMHTQPPFPQRVDVVGTYAVTEYDYFDQETGEALRSDVDQSLSLKNAIDVRLTVMYYQERNVTDFTSVVASPEDYAAKMYLGLLSPGSRWTVEYHGISNSSGVDGQRPFEHTYVLNETENCTYVGKESVDVAAGSYDCFKVRYQYPDYSATTWISSKVGADVRTEVFVAAGHQVTTTLLWYDIGRNGAEDASLSWVAMGAALAVATIAIVVLVVYITRKRPRAPTGQDGMPEGGVDRI